MFLVCEEVGLVLIFCFHITKYLPRIVGFFFRSTAGADDPFLNGMETPIPCFLLFDVASNETLIELGKIAVWVMFLSLTFSSH